MANEEHPGPDIGGGKGVGQLEARVEEVSSAAVEDLTARVRHPTRWMLRHPLRVARRRIGVAVTLTVLGVVAIVLATRANGRQGS